MLQEEIAILEQSQVKDRRIIEDMRNTLDNKDGSVDMQILINEK